ncbi:AraC family transcriptional regulator [Pedobacter sp. L105]|uniref:helix-turn-helix domain-containing protein n=1 Tax=Pedobacter sp. L105 TaxID=1641871 RepID=UPI00131AECD2|nr:helix-turn-helix transcriptional regulator [Pedobacter sp. L105]
MKNIPLDLLQEKTSIGLEIKVFKSDGQQRKPDRDVAHRDDHYIFFLLTKGMGSLVADLQDIVLSEGQLYYITPSQVHHLIKTNGAEGWFLAVDVALIPMEFRNVFEHRQSSQVPCTLTDYELKQYSALLNLLHEEFLARQGDNFYLHIIHTLLQTFLAMAASSYNVLQTSENKHTRSAELTSQFKKLLAADNHSNSTPSAYASKLNVSLGHLNESIKKVTGSTVSYWIQQEIFSEAKRLLYHSDVDVKQIAYGLGYKDYSYFSRSFRKASGMSPSAFRKLNRK